MLQYVKYIECVVCVYKQETHTGVGGWEGACSYTYQFSTCEDV